MSGFDDLFKDEDFILSEEEEETQEAQEAADMWSTGHAQDLWTTDEAWTLSEEDYNEDKEEFDMSDFFD